ncbi:MAG: hypothetical protein QXV17_01385 [Candidatus Micrarchaeaceae archaeon]
MENEKTFNPKIYSFILGPYAKTKITEQILNGTIKNIKDLKNRFSIDVINKGFYKQISELFNNLVSNIEYNANLEKKSYFVIRLIERTIFCWFLKNKKIDNIPLISDDILSKNAVLNNSDYYHTVLENLFFNKLQTIINSNLFKPINDDLDNNIKITNNWFEQFFDVLEAYNFTIDENTSIDIELSIDPEILGKLFEKLLAEINNQSGESKRHATGSYYTPRQIVDYMVDESLKHYLISKTLIDEQIIDNILNYYIDITGLDENDKNKIINAIDEIKIIDIACGSGAYPMGILQKLLYILHKIDSIDNNFVRKLNIIENTIYGVDKQEMPIEITKLRFFLSLISDVETNINTLSNIKINFVCADSLITVHQSNLLSE